MNIVVFGDNVGIPLLLECLPRHLLSQNKLSAIVAASIRPQYIPKLKEIAHQENVPFFIQPKHGTSDYEKFLLQLKSIEIDLIIVNCYSMKLHQDLLSLSRFSAINVHGALLPQYRGANPIQWAIINREVRTGVTMHYMTDTIDAGDIIAQKEVPILFEDTHVDVLDRIIVQTKSLLLEQLPKVLTGKNNRQEQDLTLARSFPRRKPEDGLFNWEQSIIAIYHLIRALVKPLPGAYYYESGKKIILDCYQSIAQIASIKYLSNHWILRNDFIAFRPLLLPDLMNADPMLEAAISSFLPCSANQTPTLIYSHLQQKNNLLVFVSLNQTSEKDRILCILSDIDYVKSTAKLDILSFHSSDCLSKFDIIILFQEFIRQELELTDLNRINHKQLANNAMVWDIQ